MTLAHLSGSWLLLAVSMKSSILEMKAKKLICTRDNLLA